MDEDWSVGLEVAEIEGKLEEKQTALKELDEKNASMEQALNEAEAELEKLGGSETEAQIREYNSTKDAKEKILADLQAR